jgi:hypothetical protein
MKTDLTIIHEEGNTTIKFECLVSFTKENGTSDSYSSYGWTPGEAAHICDIEILEVYSVEVNKTEKKLKNKKSRKLIKFIEAISEDTLEEKICETL